MYVQPGSVRGVASVSAVALLAVISNRRLVMVSVTLNCTLYFDVTLAGAKPLGTATPSAIIRSKEPALQT